MTDHPNVAQAIAAVMAEMPAIGKDQKAPGNMGGYAFRGIEDVTRALQPIFATHGVVIVPQCRITNVVPAPGQKEMWQDVYVEVDWSIYGPAGDFITATTSGIGRDHTDKGANKAQTQAYKYLLMHMLCISDSKDDVDGASYDDEPYIDPVVEKTPIQVLFDDVMPQLPEAVKQGLKNWAKDDPDKRRLTPAAAAADEGWFNAIQDKIIELKNPTGATP